MVAVALMAAGCNDAGCAAPPVPGGMTAVADGTGDDERTFRARSTADLGLPVQKALAEALAAGAPSFRVLLEPGMYRDLALALSGPAGPGGLELSVDGLGPKPVVLEGMSLDLSARRVTLRNLVIRGHRGAAATLRVGVGEEFLGERLIIASNRREEVSENDPVVLIHSAGRGKVEGRAIFRECWILDNSAAGDSAVLATPRTGRAHLESLSIERSVFVGNDARRILHPWFTRKVVISDSLIAEHRTAGAWLELISPLVEVTVAGGITAVPGPFVEYRSGPDVADGDFRRVVLRGGSLNAAGGPEWSGLETDGTELGSPLSLSPDPAALERDARLDPRPEPARLLQRLVDQ